MSDSDLFDAAAQKTGEDSQEIRRRGFVLTGPDDAGPEPECLLDVLLVDFELRAGREADPPGRRQLDRRRDQVVLQAGVTL